MITVDKAAELRERAAEHRAAARESFERCDTDGFVSQWADGINGRLCEQQARLAENGGVATFARWVLVDGAGETVDARKVTTRFGERWVIDTADGGTVWIAYGSNRAAKRKGYTVVEVIEQAQARSVLDGSGTGLSGQVWVATYRVGSKRSDGWRCVGVREDERAEEYRGAMD